ncbi:FAD/NAD(P)-binding protein [Ralstonia nicotianae]|uniref:FAD/NAD(P)-binding protein n=1 Tax=Ralstonia pseudosolanacearum TaxID=1310165 RepID=UPI0020064AB5|nr:FAD/NAD(P)-binding protein [Ralstonia pseudosolanacearum]MCK4120525.1 FAD/NAD(P)-binding protein [Ralstonia pseudosolanacearum]
MSTIAVAIIGMGPRGMTVLERLVSMGRRYPRLQLAIHIIDPGMMGCGAHLMHQPDYLLLNTVGGLPTMFPPRRHAADIDGEAFLAWARRHANGAEPSPSSYLPRALFGAYLNACFAQIERQRPANVEIVTHACDAVALSRDGRGECIECSDGTSVRSRFVVLTTGHTPNSEPRDGAIHDPYGFLANIDKVALDAHDHIGIAGFGLTSFDVLAGLTVGRGGIFRADSSGRLYYRRSGREPRICMFSRSGLPYLARPQRDCGRFEYEPLIFEADRIRSIRRANGGLGLDFLSTLLPLLSLELRAACCRKRMEVGGQPISEEDWCGLRTGGVEGIEKWLHKMERSLGTFDVTAFLGAPSLALDSGAAYQHRFVELVEADLRESRMGVAGSVTKYVAEVLLHLRDSLNTAVDFAGLDAASHDYFFGSFAATVRRLAIGPQPERNKEMVALIRAGVVTVELGPNPQIVRRPDGAFEISSRNLDRRSTCVVAKLIQARSPFPSIGQSNSPLLTCLFRSGRVRKHRDDVRFEGGVEINRLHHPIGRSGQAEESLYVLGPLCEGSIYYNTYVPTTVGWSRPFIEAETIVGQILRDAGLAAPSLEGAGHDDGSHYVLP